MESKKDRADGEGKVGGRLLSEIVMDDDDDDNDSALESKFHQAHRIGTEAKTRSEIATEALSHVGASHGDALSALRQAQQRADDDSASRSTATATDGECKAQRDDQRTCAGEGKSSVAALRASGATKAGERPSGADRASLASRQHAGHLDRSDWTALGHVGRIELTPDGRLLRRLYAFVFRSIVADLDAFYAKHLPLFSPSSLGPEALAAVRSTGKLEQRVEWYAAFKEFEALMDGRLADFARDEGFDSGVQGLHKVVAASCAAPDPEGASLASREERKEAKKNARFVKQIVAATSYGRFVRMMADRAAKREKKDE